MTPILINSIQYQLPESWEEITVKQFLELQAERPNYIARLISSLTGLEYSLIENANTDLSPAVIESLEFIGNPPDFSKMLVKDEITIGAKSLKVPKDISEETFGQKTIMQQAINDCFDEVEGERVINNRKLNQKIPFAIATYFQPAYYGEKYDGKKAEEFERVTQNCKIVEAFPVANFFLSRSLNSLTVKVSS